MASPFKDWSNFATSNALSDTVNPAANQTVFVYSGTYSGVAALKSGQNVLGQGATIGLASYAGITAGSLTSGSTTITNPTNNGI